MGCEEITIDLSNEPCGDGTNYDLARFAREISTVNFRNLKILLKVNEERENYEYCRLIQNEIDSRVCT